VTYQIRVEGELGVEWSDWFEGLSMSLDGQVTTLTGPVADQAALRGILEKLWNLNLALISVARVTI
jgi:hypothetical protein